jgi:hypothetical protein
LNTIFPSPLFIDLIVQPIDSDVRYADPLEVRPDRWIPFVAPSPFDFPVFQVTKRVQLLTHNFQKVVVVCLFSCNIQAGPRICLGMNMALIEAKMLTCMLLQKFTFALLPGEAEKITYSAMITMSLCNSKKADSHNLWLVPQPRMASSEGAAKIAKETRLEGEGQWEDSQLKRARIGST